MPLIFFISLYVFLASFGLTCLNLGILLFFAPYKSEKWNAAVRKLLFITGFVTICLGFLTLIIAVVSNIIGAPAS
jgi:hypothetical protein